MNIMDVDGYFLSVIVRVQYVHVQYRNAGHKLQLLSFF